jgi:voltage-gated potassium channel
VILYRGKMKQYRQYQQTLGISAAQQLRISLGLAAFVIVVGTLGFMYLENWPVLDSLYMTIITLSTVGFGEVRQLHDESRMFTMVLIILGVAVGGLTATSLGRVIVEGQFKELVLRRKMEKKLRRMENHYIVAGYGRVGRQVALEFKRRHVPFVVIERDPAAVETLTANQILFVEGDATDEEVLREAGIEQAQTLISTLPDEAHNVYLTLTARHMSSSLTIIARADVEEEEKKLIRAGANNVISPHVLGGVRMAMAATQPNVVDFVQMTGFGTEGLIIEEITIPQNSALNDKTIVESGLKDRYGVTIIGIKKQGGKMVINPTPKTTLNSGDILVLIGDQANVEQLNADLKL